MHAPTSQPADEALALQSVQGSREAFGLLVARYARMVRAICTARVGAREVDDIVQEVFLRAYRGLGRLKDPSRFPSYLAQIARNLCVDRLRSPSRPTVSLDEVELDVPDTSLDGADEKAGLLARLRREVGRLPESQREVLLLFYFQKMSYADMAAALEVTEAAVNQRLSRARQHLRSVFSVGSES